MRTTKNEALLILAQRIMDQRIKPVIDKAMITPKSKPIPYNAALDNNDYAEYIASKEGTLVHMNRKEKKEICNTTMISSIHKTR